MAEPTASTAALHGGASFLGGLVVLFGPHLGPWIAVTLASSVGALWTVGKVETFSRLHATALLARTVLTACVLTGAIAVLMGAYTSAANDYLLPLTAFALGAIGDKFESLKDAVVSRLRSLIGGSTK